MSADDAHEEVERQARAIKPETVDYEAVARVSTAVDVSNVRNVLVHAACLPDPADVAPDWSDYAFVGFDSAPRPSPIDAPRVLVRSSFVAVYFPGLDPEAADMLPAPDDDRPPSIEIQATFELSYAPKDPDGPPLDAGDLEHFAFMNGTFHAWPYWRELAQSCTVRMGVPPLVVGAFKIPSAHDPGR